MKLNFLLIIIFTIFLVNIDFSQTNLQTNTNLKPYLEDFYSKDNAIQSTITTDKEPKPVNPIWTIVKTILYVGIFIVIGYFIIAYVIKKNSPQFSDENIITEIIMTKPLGIGNYIQIIRIGTQYYILGVSSNNMILIDKITDKETIDSLELNKEKLKPENTRFYDLLSFIPSSKKTDKIEYIKKQKEKLKNL